jgi:glutathione S-transferase
MLIHELGLDVELHAVDFAKGEHKSPAYLARNPNGKVPTLEDGDFWLWESNAIMGYLADKKPGHTLYPMDAHARADVNRWLFWESAHFGAACYTLATERVIKPMMMKLQPDPAIVAFGESNLARFAAVLETQLKSKEYVTGRLSLADLALSADLMYQQPSQIDLKPFPAIDAWFARMQTRDSWKKTTPQY